MKKLFSLVFLVLLSITVLEGAYVGKVYAKPRDGAIKEKLFMTQSTDLANFFASEIKKGNLQLTMIQEDPIASMEHHRYSQFFKGLEVFGGQIIQHYRNGEMVGINGEYYEIDDIDTVPVIAKDEAVGIFRYDLRKEGLEERSEESKLIIYPVKDGDYHLAYEIILEKGLGYSMTGIIDAKTGAVLLKYSNIWTDEAYIGLGTGYHGGTYKFPTTYVDEYGVYGLYDEKNIRPVAQITYDWNLGGYVPADDDNIWDYYSAVISAHVFAGWTYDYYYLAHSRNGIDDNNLDIVVNVNWAEDGTDNAHWSPSENQMFFYLPTHEQNAAAIDTVAHEYSHGVTQYSANLIYVFESGALNESFSDIIGAAVEHHWLPEGMGFLKADWYHGEDAKSSFSVNGCRNLADPNSNSQLKNAGFPSYLWYPDPCHLSQEIPIIYDIYGHPIDNGGVHLNMTIYSHAYYLLAQGGTNKVSQKQVNGIGIDKATKIFYSAWVYYLTPYSDFLDAANALLYSAYDLYGSGSNEYAQTVKSMEAIGWVVY